MTVAVRSSEARICHRRPTRSRLELRTQGHGTIEIDVGFSLGGAFFDPMIDGSLKPEFELSTRSTAVSGGSFFRFLMLERGDPDQAEMHVSGTVTLRLDGPGDALRYDALVLSTLALVRIEPIPASGPATRMLALAAAPFALRLRKSLSA